MLIISSTYTAPLDQVDAIRPAHIEWLKVQHAAGHFHGWGRKTPPTGGVILAVGDRAAIEALAQTDPYIVAGVAQAEIIEFGPAFLAPGLEILGG
ncbi:MAG TPA: YciI family protein [Sphingobium sp.]